MGGVFFDVDGTPCVWRTPFPPEAQQRLVTVENPEGDITNSDLGGVFIVRPSCAMTPQLCFKDLKTALDACLWVQDQ